MSAIFIMADKKARDQWGKGWEHLGNQQKRGAVALEILTLSAAQDEAVSAERIRQINDEAYAKLIATYEVV